MLPRFLMHRHSMRMRIIQMMRHRATARRLIFIIWWRETRLGRLSSNPDGCDCWLFCGSLFLFGAPWCSEGPLLVAAFSNPETSLMVGGGCWKFVACWCDCRIILPEVMRRPN